MLNKLNNRQKYEILMQIGQDRLRNICSICHKQMDIKKYHIQICSKCRKIGLAYFQREILSRADLLPLDKLKRKGLE